MADIASDAQDLDNVDFDAVDDNVDSDDSDLEGGGNINADYGETSIVDDEAYN